MHAQIPTHSFTVNVMYSYDETQEALAHFLTIKFSYHTYLNPIPPPKSHTDLHIYIILIRWE